MTQKTVSGRRMDILFWNNTILILSHLPNDFFSLDLRVNRVFLDSTSRMLI